MASRAGSEAMQVDEPLQSRSLAPRGASVPLVPDKFLVGYVYSEQMMLHSSDSDHPEKPGRIAAVHNLLEKNSLVKRMKRIPIRQAKRDEVLLVHAEQLWQSVLKLSKFTREDILISTEFYEKESLYVSPQTPLAARFSCGGVIDACLAVARGELQKTFANVRPPGHHAEPGNAMGFCFFNNVAIAAKTVQQLTRTKRILILDWDVHHGNGTHKAFNDDPSVLYISLHRYEGGVFYPGGPFGGMESCGEAQGRGFSVNIPWPTRGMGDADYIHAFQKIVMPISTEFAPELVIISAGFDAAEGDPLGEFHLSPAAFAHMTHMLSGLAGGRVVAALEGGYNIDATADTALAVARTLLGESPPEMGPLVASEIGTETVFLVAKEQSKYWKSIDVRACEPREEDVEEVTWTIPELLKAHRQEYMYREFEMLEIPLMHEDMRERYSSQVMCTKDIMDNANLVIFVHEFGNIKAELANSITCEVKVEHSYLVDASKRLATWCRQQRLALVDVNLYPRAPRDDSLFAPTKSAAEYTRALMLYLWDNYVLLSNAKHVILVGHGPGVSGVMDLIDGRAVGVQRYVKLVAQLVGYSKIPLVPRNSGDVTAWYLKHSMIFVPPDHPIRREGKMLKRHGTTVVIDETKPIKLLLKAFGNLESEVQKRLNLPPTN